MADPQVIAAFQAALRKRRAGHRVAKALFEGGITEAELENPSHGDADSLGALQERTSIYGRKHALDPYQSAMRFIKQAQQINQRGFQGSAGKLAQMVQRSAFPDRYDTHSAEAENYVKGILNGKQGAPVAGSAPTVGQSADPLAVLKNYIANTQHLFDDQPQDPGSGIMNTVETLKRITGKGQESSAPSQVNDAPSGVPGMTMGSGSAASQWAQSRIGHYVESTGKNTGPELDALEQRFGMTGQPWCAIFATTAATHGGAPRSIRTASVAQIVQMAQHKQGGYAGFFPASQAQSGDLITFGTHHVGLVDFVDKQGRIHTIEGNTSNGRVSRVIRSPQEASGVARPRYGRR